MFGRRLWGQSTPREMSAPQLPGRGGTEGSRRNRWDLEALGKTAGKVEGNRRQPEGTGETRRGWEQLEKSGATRGTGRSQELLGVTGRGALGRIRGNRRRTRALGAVRGNREEPRGARHSQKSWGDREQRGGQEAAGSREQPGRNRRRSGGLGGTESSRGAPGTVGGARSSQMEAGVRPCPAQPTESAGQAPCSPTPVPAERPADIPAPPACIPPGPPSSSLHSADLSARSLRLPAGDGCPRPSPAGQRRGEGRPAPGPAWVRAADSSTQPAALQRRAGAGAAQPRGRALLCGRG